MKSLCGTLQKEKCNLLVNESFDFKNVLGLNSHIKRPTFSIYKIFNLLVRCGFAPQELYLVVHPIMASNIKGWVI